MYDYQVIVRIAKTDSILILYYTIYCAYTVRTPYCRLNILCRIETKDYSSIALVGMALPFRFLLVVLMTYLTPVTTTTTAKMEAATAAHTMSRVCSENLPPSGSDLSGFIASLWWLSGTGTGHFFSLL